MNERPSILCPLIPGMALPGDWHQGKIPANIVAGANSVIDSSHSFVHYQATGVVGLRVGNNVTICRASFAVARDGKIEIGDDCYITDASFVCCSRIAIGKRVMIAGGVTIVDCDCCTHVPLPHMLDAIGRSADEEQALREGAPASAVTIGDDVWIGSNATIRKGVVIGAGAVIAPGAVVTRSVPARAYVAGGPCSPSN
jgi:acetyltransferase-like isoleucine patch superfamily enzyme